MTPERLLRLIVAASTSVIAQEQELTALDQAIGDGDHGLNMRRGSEAILAEATLLSSMPLPDALVAIGNRLVMTIGGASGPLFGTMLIALGKDMEPGGANFPHALTAAVGAVMARGKSLPGQKTMIDVLIPVRDAVLEGKPDLLGCLPGIARDAASATAPVRAARGRASFLGDRSVGHIDPGAWSTSIIVGAVCGAWEK